MGILELLWAWRKQIGLGLIVLAVLGYIATLKGEIVFYKHKAETTKTQLDTANAQLIVAGAQIAKLNSAVQNLSDEGKRKSAHAKALQTKYEGSVKKWQEFVGGLTLWNPNPDENECQAAKRILREYRK